MTQAAIYRAIMRVGQPGYDPVEKMIRLEKRRFKRAAILRPGDTLVPLNDWREAVITLAGRQARIVLVDAHQTNTGAFTRLVEGLKAAGYAPVVIDPTPRFAATLLRRGWKGERVGNSFSTREMRFTP